MSFRSENERNKAVVDAFYQLGIQGRLIDFAQYLDPNFTWTAPNYLPWGGTHTGAVLFRDQVLSSLPDVFDFAQFSYVSVIAADGRVDAVINQRVSGTDAVIKIVDCWTVRDGKVTSIWVAYFEPQALLEKLGIAHAFPISLSATCHCSCRNATVPRDGATPSAHSRKVKQWNRHSRRHRSRSSFRGRIIRSRSSAIQTGS